MSDPDAALSAGPERSVPEEAPTAKRSSKGRSAAVIICVVLAALLTTPAAIAYWGQRTLNDATRYVNTVGPLVNSPEVQDAIATKVTDTIQKEVDVEALLNQVFSGVITDRPRLQRLVGPLAAAINSFIDRQVREFLASDQFADLWIAANTRAQQSLQRILKGDQSGAVQLQGDQVVLDLSDVIDQVKQRLVDRGLTILQNVPIPNVDKQIVLMEAPQLKQIRTIYAFANPLAQWLIVLVAALYLAALVLARRRPRMTVIIGALLAANALLLALALSVGRQLFIDALAGTTFGPASRVFYDQLLSYLDRGRQVFFWLGLSLVVIGWFAGSNRYGTAVRGSVNGGLEGIGGALADSPVGGAGRWVAANVRWLRVVVALLGVVVLLWGNNISLSRLFWSLALVVGLLAVLQVLVGAGRTPVASGPVAPPGAVPGTAK
ncbi:hypothetical protein OG555_36570 [Kribbella sp. NBC_01484]|uniref:hypothetical protein n=1 Tax=Kribbella sp. NBC_01484 TaxID=2903579 RepID=UPI002E31275F|nr:hypothetical protein [Kribbella sp. NBC_01484]